MLPTMPEYNAIITIRLNADGVAEGHIAFGDGSEMTRALREVSGDMFETIDSRSGDKYQIVANQGISNSWIMTAEVARRLENMPQAR